MVGPSKRKLFDPSIFIPNFEIDLSQFVYRIFLFNSNNGILLIGKDFLFYLQIILFTKRKKIIF